MELPYQNHGDGRDVWIKSLPVQRLAHVIMESLTTSANSDSLPDVQIILVGKFILSTVIDLQNFNKSCQDANCADLMETTECDRYLELFDKIFQRILQTSNSISKEEIMELVWKYHNEGTIDFSTTSIPQLLMQSMSPEVLQEKLLDALFIPTDKTRLNYLVSACCPSSPTNFSLIMNNLFTIFKNSGFHSQIMEFTRLFVSSIKDQYPINYYNLFPTCFVPILLVYDFLLQYFPEILPAVTNNEGTKAKKTSSRKCEHFILTMLDTLYNPSNMNKYVSYNRLEENFISFYVASCCPRLLHLIQRTFDNGELSFQLYPYLWIFLREKEKNKYIIQL